MASVRPDEPVRDEATRARFTLDPREHGSERMLMRVAIISDIHANMQALTAVERDARAQRVDQFWCLGDVVGYGGDPRAVFEWVETNVTHLVKGNHDEAVSAGEMRWFNEVAAEAARFHATLLRPDERSRMYSWPVSIRPEVDLDILLVHASPDDPLSEYVLPSDALHALSRWGDDASLIFMGHTHVPFVAERPSANKSREWNFTGFAQRLEAPAGRSPAIIVNPGSVGQPRDQEPRASYAILDMDARTVELRRVEYDVDAAAEAIRRAGLPASLGNRLFSGR